jgi:two-component system capsular synthesis sensor histidine kinase RcsC
MDFVMPNMNGPDATRAIRLLGYTGPIVGLTGNALAEDKVIFMKAGTTDVLIKPLKMSLLQKIIKL